MTHGCEGKELSKVITRIFSVKKRTNEIVRGKKCVQDLWQGGVNFCTWNFGRIYGWGKKIFE